MSNPLYNQYNNSTMQSNITKFNNQLKENYDQMQKELEQKFNSFANWFKGNPRQVVQNLLNSGRLSQNDLNQLKIMAEQRFGAKF